RLQPAERCVRERGDGVECREEPAFVEVGRLERESKVIAEAERLRGPVAKTRQLADVAGDLAADALRRFPRGSAARGVVARAEDVENLVVVDRLAVDRAAMAGETRLDVALEVDDLPPEFGGDLMRRVRLREHIELPGYERVEARVVTRVPDCVVRLTVGERVG